MTICLVMRCRKKVGSRKKHFLLFASDTQESSLYLKRSVTKIRTIFGGPPKKQESTWSMLVASAGDSMVIDEVVDDIGYLLRERIAPDEEKPSIQLRMFRKELGDLAYNTYKKYKDRKVRNPHFELMLGAADKFSTILHITCEGKNKQLEQFGIIGSGRITGGELLLTELLRKDINDHEAARLATLVIKTVGHVDLSVGGEPYIALCGDRISWKYKEFAFRDILKKPESRWNLMKKVWSRLQEDDTLEKKLSQLLSKKKRKRAKKSA